MSDCRCRDDDRCPDRIHVVWFTQAGETPRLYLASSGDHGVSFTKPVLFDPAQKLAKHAHIVAGSGNRLLIAWDDMNNSFLVKWGFFDLSTKALKMIGTQAGASYPIVAMDTNRIAVTSLQSNETQIFRSIQRIP